MAPLPGASMPPNASALSALAKADKGSSQTDSLFFGPEAVPPFALQYTLEMPK
jgi:hypothetical protein